LEVIELIIWVERALLLAQSIETEATPLPLDVAREFEQACFFVSMISKCVPENSELIAPHHGIPKKRLSWKASELDTERPLRGQMMELIEHWYVQFVIIELNQWPYLRLGSRYGILLVL
jgi:hypothetical protein